jgi:hypothetical protein
MRKCPKLETTERGERKVVAEQKAVVPSTSQGHHREAYVRDIEYHRQPLILAVVLLPFRLTKLELGCLGNLAIPGAIIKCWANPGPRRPSLLDAMRAKGAEDMDS